jgi:hypothetical protein
MNVASMKETLSWKQRKQVAATKMPPVVIRRMGKIAVKKAKGIKVVAPKKRIRNSKF